MPPLTPARIATFCLFLVAVGIFWWMTPRPRAAAGSGYVHVAGQSQVQVARTSADLDRLARGLPAQTFSLPDRTPVHVLDAGVVRAEIETVDGRHGWIPAEWLK